MHARDGARTHTHTLMPTVRTEDCSSRIREFVRNMGVFLGSPEDMKRLEFFIQLVRPLIRKVEYGSRLGFLFPAGKPVYVVDFLITTFLETQLHILHARKTRKQ